MVYKIRENDMVALVDVKQYSKKLTEETKKYFQFLEVEMEDTDDQYLINSVLWLTIDIKDILNSQLLCSLGGLAPKNLKMIVFLGDYIKDHSKEKPMSLTLLNYLTDSLKKLRLLVKFVSDKDQQQDNLLMILFKAQQKLITLLHLDEYIHHFTEPCP